FVEDGRAFIERAHAQGEQYDLILLDAFDVDYIPPHLLTVEFLQHAREVLSPDGVRVANTFSECAAYDRAPATYASVYEESFNLRAGYRAILATRVPLRDRETVARNARSSDPPRKRFGIDAQQQWRRFTTKKDWDPNAQVLADPPAGGSWRTAAACPPFRIS